MTEALQLEIRTLRALLDSERDPGGRAFAPLADAYRRAGQIPEAIRLLRDGIAKHPDFVTGHVVAAQLYVEHGLTAEGAIAARRALQLDGENVNALKSLLRALDETGERDEAESVRSVLTTLEPDFTPDWGAPTRGAADVAAELAMDRDASAGDEPAGLGTEEPAAPAVDEFVLDEIAHDESPALAPEPEAGPFGGTIDLTTLAPLPFADLTPSALAPELPAVESTGAQEASEIELDVGFAGLELAGGETLEASAEPQIEEPVLELAGLAPDDEPVMDLPLLAPDADADDEPVMDLASLAPGASVDEEPVMDLALLAPDAAVDEEPVMDLALLAPDVADDEPVMDLALLAPDVADDEPVMDLALLAPDVADEEPVMDLALLAPDAAGDEEPVLELASLAPETEESEPDSLPLVAEPSLPEVPEEAPVFERDDLVARGDADYAPTETAATAPGSGSNNGQMSVEEAVEVGFAAPDDTDELIVDLDALRAEHTAVSSGPPSTGALEVDITSAATSFDDPRADDPAFDDPGAVPDLPTLELDSDEAPDTPADDGEPVPTRTLAELYASQGAVKEAIAVLRHLRDLNPQDAGLARRIAELEAGVAGKGGRGEPEEAEPEDPADQEVEALARELSEGGRGAKDVDSPFAWADREATPAEADGPTIREYFDGLLNWEPRDS